MMMSYNNSYVHEDWTHVLMTHWHRYYDVGGSGRQDHKTNDGDVLLFLEPCKVSVRRWQVMSFEMCSPTQRMSRVITYAKAFLIQLHRRLLGSDGWRNERNEWWHHKTNWIGNAYFGENEAIIYGWKGSETSATT